MLWSQIIYGHRTAFISPKNRTILRSPYGARPAAGRIVPFFIKCLDIVRCPVKLRNYLKFHGARLVGSTRIKWHRPGTVRCPDGARPAFAHIGRAPDDFSLKFISYDSNSTMFYESNCHRWAATCFCRKTYCIYRDISFLKTNNINTDNIFRLSS